MPQSKRKPGGRTKHIPQRTCVACRKKSERRDYIRLVRTEDGQVVIDRTGKRNGRGAYLCPTRACWYRALESNVIDTALKIELDQAAREDFREYARTHFPPETE